VPTDLTGDERAQHPFLEPPSVRQDRHENHPQRKDSISFKFIDSEGRNPLIHNVESALFVSFRGAACEALGAKA
jgi:hypothetical protein